MFQFKTSTLSLLLVFITTLSACSNKSPQTAECGEGTVQQGMAVGSIVGAVAGKLAHSNMFVGAIVGGLIGYISTTKLASLQCQYLGKEKKLLENITQNIEKQNNLAQQTNILNNKMTLLYQEIKEIEKEKIYQDSQKNNLLSKINAKKEEILNIQQLNREVIDSTSIYYNSLNDSSFSKQDKESVQNSLSHILSSLHNIENASIYNLNQLEKFKRKIQ